MARCIFEGLTSEQADVFARWFSGQGEQDAEIWFDARGTPSPRSVGRPVIQANGDVVVQCRGGDGE